jgi:predicted nucleotidyltransferase
METKLSELVARLKSAASDNLKAVVLYGSAATSDFHGKHSDLNILCLVERAAVADLEHMHGVSEWWMKENNPAPVIFTHDELMRSADVFAIELLDMKHRHRMLLGDDFLEKMEVPLRLHRLQVERELRTNWMRLRQAIVAAPPKKKVHLDIMLSSVATFCVLFRHALIGAGQPEPLTKREAVENVATLSGGDASGFRSILDFRAGQLRGKDIDIEATLHSYSEFVEVVTNEVDRRFETT